MAEDVHSIKCTSIKKVGDDQELVSSDTDVQYDVTVDSEGGTYICKIECDDTPDLNNFDTDEFGIDPFTVTRNRCELTVIIPPNKSNHDRAFTIYCNHTVDSTIYLQLNFNQKKDIYEVKIIQEETDPQIELKSLFKSTDPNKLKEEKSLTIKVSGGSGKYRIKSIRGYKNSDDKVGEKFDNGFVYYKNGDELKIINYGRTFINDGGFYKMVLCHNDDKGIEETLEIRYDTVESVTS